MRINRLVLENYGLFAGHNEFELAPQKKSEKKRPIVLLGGMNGAGKTTILNAVKLALYGKTAFGDRVSQKEYHQHLSSLIHRSRSLLVPAPFSRVALEFDFVSRGQQDTYYIERFWQSNNGSGISEDFQVRVKPPDAQAHLLARDWPLLNTEPEYWQDFVSDIVPTRLSQLFFFDGEKIRKIASDISGSAAIGESIRSLIGLDIVDRLRADLSIYAARETRSFGTAAESEKIAELSKALEHLQNASAQLLSEELPQLETQILGVQREIGKLETRLQEEGSSFADKRQEHRQRIAVLEHRNGIVLREIANAAEGLFPLALCPTVARNLLNHIKSAADLKRRLLISGQHRKINEEIAKKLKSAKLPSDTDERTRVLSIIDEILEVDVSPGTKLQNADFATELSEGDSTTIRECVKKAATSEFPKMQQLCRELESISRELQNLKQKLARIPEQESLQPLFADLSKKNQELGILLSRRSALQEESRQIQTSITTKERERDRLLATIQTTESTSKRLLLVSDVQTALDSYLSRLTQFKTSALSTAVARCFNQISRKEDLIREILVDPSTFAVTLLDNRSLPIPKEELSSGEKQILAIALLWGLAQTSGRPLPVIIDTPLGRLDSAHRNNLVKHYFPHAAHQVILLSTDTEVDKVLFEELKHGVSHCYHLIYDQQETRTYAKKEYFWEEGTNA